MRLCRSLVVSLMLGTVSVEAAAQRTGQSGRIPIPYRTYIGLDPAFVPFNFGAVEIESGVAQGITLGVNASYTDVDRRRWTSGDLKLRYYPGEVVLRGISIGLTAGYLRYSAITGQVPERQAMDAPTVGLAVDYNWLLGQSRRFVVGTGIGAKRVLAGRDERVPVDIGPAYVTGRFILGLAF